MAYSQFYPRTAAEIAASVVPTILGYPPGNVLRYGADATNTSDCTAAFLKACAQDMAGGEPVEFTNGTYKFSTRADISTVGSPTFGRAPRIRGAGMVKPVINIAVANDAAWNCKTHSSSEFALGLQIENLEVTSSASTAVASFVKLSTEYFVKISNCYIHDILGTGIQLPETLGDTDANTWVEIEQCAILNCAGWGINAAPLGGLNQNGFIKITNCWIQGCGTTMATTAITGITAANPAVVSSTAHGFSNGQYVYMYNILGAFWANGIYVVGGVTANTFQLTGINSTSLAAYTSGGLVRAREPTSGGIALANDTYEIDSCGLTINKNVGLALGVYGTSGGTSSLARGGLIVNTDFENNGPVQIQCTNVQVLRMTNNEMLNSVANPAAHQLILDSFTSTMDNIQIDGMYIRKNPTGAANGCVTYYQCGGNINNNTVRVRNTTWNVADYTNQDRFIGPWQFDAIPNNMVLTRTGATALQLTPNTLGPSYGNSCAIRLRGPASGSAASTNGEWVPISSAAIVTSPVTGLANNTLYYIYLQDVAGTATLIASTTSFVTDPTSGYSVKSDDATARWVGTWKTDGSAHFLATFTYACLPAYNLVQPGTRYQISDASAAYNTFMAAAAGGAANVGFVTSDGATNWYFA